MKEIWINLELYFESYEFSNFRDFLWNLFSFLSIKNNSKGQKGVYFRAGPTWMRRDTQGHVAEPRGPTRVPAWRGGDTYTYYIYHHT